MMSYIKHSMQRGINLPLENYPPPLIGQTSPSLKMKPPPNFSNSSDLRSLLISMPLCRFLQILERTFLYMVAQFNRSSNHKLWGD